MTVSERAAGVAIRPMQRADLDSADQVLRLAFGTRLRLPDPMQFRGDSRILQPRWAASPDLALVAENEGRIAGSIVGMDWGRVFVLGPLSVAPEYSGRGIARKLMSALMARADARGFDLAGLFTFPDSPTHIRLYEGFGFVPNTLTPVMAKAVEGAEKAAPDCVLYSALSRAGRESALADCRVLSGAVFPGLDLSREIEAISAQGLGETVLIRANGGLAGFALPYRPWQRGGQRYPVRQIRRLPPGRPGGVRTPVGRLREPGAGQGRSPPGGGLQHRARGSLSPHASPGLSRRDRRGRHAPPRPGRLQPARDVRPRRLALRRGNRSSAPAFTYPE